jgi:ABC-2 type transport system ATP-binding protein
LSEISNAGRKKNDLMKRVLMIETHDLSKQFHDFMAVDGVDLSVQEGQILALLGQNGAGKTTTVRMLTALLEPTRGWARVAGYDVTKNGHDVRASVGVLTEQHGLYMRMNALEYLEFFGQVYGLSPSLRKSRRIICWNISVWQRLQSAGLVSIRRGCVKNWRWHAR